MKLSDAFWNSHKGLVLVASNGELGFTPAGRKRYAKPMAQHGFAIANVRTLNRFCDVMNTVSAGELDANTRQLHALLESPETSQMEQALIRRVLGISPAA
jgi:hypothetical protein